MFSKSREHTNHVNKQVEALKDLSDGQRVNTFWGQLENTMTGEFGEELKLTNKLKKKKHCLEEVVKIEFILKKKRKQVF